MKKYQLTQEQAAALLEEILERCDLEQNKIPLDTFESYSNYRQEKYAVQKRILIVIMCLFILLPFFFFTVNISLSKKDSNHLVLYNLKVENYFPIKQINATIDNSPMAVYETSDKNFVVKATKNGTMNVKVVLWNKQEVSEIIEVSGCDENAPELIRYEKNNNQLYIYINDAESGINYDSVYGVDENNKRIYPLTYNKKEQYVVFDASKSNIYIPDLAGNKLHIALK